MTTIPTAVDDLIRAVVQGRRLTQHEAHSVFSALSSGALSELSIVALLVALRARGETPEEVAGAAQAFRAAAVDFPALDLPLIDIVGTGGDGHHTINISTAAAIVAASMGMYVAKHGNRSVSSLSGAADVISALGLPLELGPEGAAARITTHRFCFLFAQRYHPAMAHVAGVRKQLATPTVFNLLGPLVNPAPSRYQVLGVANPDLLDMIASAMTRLDRERALIVHGAGTDEIALHGTNDIREVAQGKVMAYTITPEDLGLHRWTLNDLAGGDPASNAAYLEAVFAGEGQLAHQETIAANTGAMLYTAGHSATIADGAQEALAHIQSGAVASHLNAMRRHSV